MIAHDVKQNDKGRLFIDRKELVEPERLEDFFNKIQFILGLKVDIEDEIRRSDEIAKIQHTTFFLESAEIRLAVFVGMPITKKSKKTEVSLRLSW